MEISSKQVAELRSETGAGMMDCKKALVEAGGDFEGAKKILRKKGLAAAARKAERAASEGLVVARVTPKAAVLVEVNCETDFVARTSDFRSFADGLADQIGWKNVHHARAGFEITPLKGLPLTANYHSWWLAEANDAIYNAGSAVLARVATGAASRHVGQEIDVQVSRALTPQIQLAAGYAHMFTGAFLKQATPGASYSAPYVMVTYVFLADK